MTENTGSRADVDDRAKAVLVQIHAGLVRDGAQFLADGFGGWHGRISTQRRQDAKQFSSRKMLAPNSKRAYSGANPRKANYGRPSNTNTTTSSTAARQSRAAAVQPRKPGAHVEHALPFERAGRIYHSLIRQHSWSAADLADQEKRVSLGGHSWQGILEFSDHREHCGFRWLVWCFYIGVRRHWLPPVPAGLLRRLLDAISPSSS